MSLVLVDLQLVAMHMGALHPVEKLLTLVLAFGPFLVLGAVVVLRRGHEDEDADVAEQDDVRVREARTAAGQRDK